ncbi:MAG: phosphatidyl-myo-inositol alpha-mannosyltransferase [Nocardioidaceae bacterium]|jgi:phosphatidylinositol alpha-mannosyltransferase|nr:phosphatidyl-myo-inositol alpha-mannosyltransferase [Nocardioidaceae bacterium]
MRIGLVCPYSFDVHGGVQTHVRALADDLAASGHHVEVLAPGEQGRVGPDALPAYVTTTGRAIAMPYNGSVARVSFGPLVAARVRRWLADGRFDVLHIHEPATPSVSVLALWATDAPVVATFHTAQERSRTLETSAATVLRAGLTKIAGHIAVSPEARSTMQRYLAVAPAVIPNGVRTTDFSALSQPGRAASGRPPTLAFVGRLDEPRKGLPLLLRAMPGIVARHPDVRLVVVGAGNQRTALRGLDPRLAERVDVVGPVADRTKARLLADADVLVAPNTHGESFGIVLVEAMASCTAVVASDLPAFRRVLGGGTLGELCPPGRPSRLADAVCRLLADPEHHERLVRRAAAAAAAYDWSVITPQVVDVYASVLDASREVVAG